MNIQLAFGKTLKQLRKDAGISQEQFALMIGMDRTYYASVESGKRNISIQNIQKISNGFHISLADLFKQVEGNDM
mgnify:CR=1 FL=1